MMHLQITEAQLYSREELIFGRRPQLASELYAEHAFLEKASLVQ